MSIVGQALRRLILKFNSFIGSFRLLFDHFFVSQFLFLAHAASFKTAFFAAQIATLDVLYCQRPVLLLQNFVFTVCFPVLQFRYDFIVRDDNQWCKNVRHEVGNDDDKEDEEEEGTVRSNLIHLVQVLELSHCKHNRRDEGLDNGWVFVDFIAIEDVLVCRPRQKYKRERNQVCCQKLDNFLK